METNIFINAESTMEENLFSSLGLVIFGALSTAALALAFFCWCGKEWIESRFAERFAIIKREHHYLVGKLKADMEAMFSEKQTRVQDFSSLSGTWERLEKAHSAVTGISSPQGALMHVQHMDIFELEETMGAMEWLQSEINSVKSVDGFARQKRFDEIRLRYQLRRVNEVCDELDAFVAAHAIFYSRDMLEEIQSLAATLRAVLNHKEHRGEPAADGENAPPPPVIDEQFKARLDAVADAMRRKIESQELLLHPAD